MSTDTALIEKRDELKRRLAAGEYKTLIDVFLDWFDRLLRKIIRRSTKLPIWLITTILTIATALFSYAMLYVSGDLNVYREVAERNRLGYGFGILFHILGFVLPIASAVTINQYIDGVLILWHDDIVDSTESVASLKDFEDWLKKVRNRRLQFLVLIILNVSWWMQAYFDPGILGGGSYGSIFTLTIGVWFFYSLVYQFLLILLLSARLRRYDLKLFAADPSSSRILARLARELNIVVYLVAVFAAAFTLVFSTWGEAIRQVGIYLVLFVWLPIIVMFILNQTSLSSIIRRVKWKTLNEIQGKVEKLQAGENFEDKETMDAINRLIDYHDRVKATSNSAIDLGAILNFINSLLLPLLAFILGNLDLVLNLFVRNP